MTRFKIVSFVFLNKFELLTSRLSAATRLRRVRSIMQVLLKIKQTLQCSKTRKLVKTERKFPSLI